MCGVQLRDELAALHPRVLSERARQRLEGFGKLLDSVLLQSRAGLSHKNTAMFLLLVSRGHRRKECADSAGYLSVGSEVLGQLDLCGACSRHQSLVLRSQHVQPGEHCCWRSDKFILS